ncbi:MAG TPA: TonB-dependent receptor [Opitutales bacterium]|jgi:hypothetical protein|nr:TonB-dependent receptor [Opitutales bacterium]
MPETTQREKLSTSQKALAINLDAEIYGTFAEIGAGQEVARHFFQAGGAAGTIAKSMSAYDMKFSDDIYGKAHRYVSRERLQQMLDHEYQLLTERLGEVRGDRTTFFVYANTVAAASFKGNTECHGWMGMRLQLRPHGPPNDIIIHVRMWDKTALSQQDALGIIGVNLVYGAALLHTDIQEFIVSLADNLGIQRIEVDMIEFNGPDFEHVENRSICLHLVQHGLTNAVLYSPDRHVLQPSEILYKKAILVERGSFRPVTHVNIDMLDAAGAQFLQDEKNRGEEVVVLMEITIHNLLAGGELNLDDFLARVDTLAALGYHVLISNYSEFFRLTDYFRRFTKKMVGIALGINNLLEVFNEQYYDNLAGGILEACGRLFKENTRMYVYPMKGSGYNRYLSEQAGNATATGGPPAPQGMPIPGDWLITAQNLQVKIHLRNLYAYLLENHYIEPLLGFHSENLGIFSRDVLKKISDGDPSWEKLVPAQAAVIIKDRHLWGYKPAVPMTQS